MILKDPPDLILTIFKAFGANYQLFQKLMKLYFSNTSP